MRIASTNLPELLRRAATELENHHQPAPPPIKDELVSTSEARKLLGRTAFERARAAGHLREFGTPRRRFVLRQEILALAERMRQAPRGKVDTKDLDAQLGGIGRQ